MLTINQIIPTLSSLQSALTSTSKIKISNKPKHIMNGNSTYLVNSNHITTSISLMTSSLSNLMPIYYTHKHSKNLLFSN